MEPNRQSSLVNRLAKPMPFTVTAPPRKSTLSISGGNQNGIAKSPNGRIGAAFRAKERIRAARAANTVVHGAACHLPGFFVVECSRLRLRTRLHSTTKKPGK